jgi:hypothetical protein
MNKIILGILFIGVIMVTGCGTNYSYQDKATCESEGGVWTKSGTTWDDMVARYFCSCPPNQFSPDTVHCQTITPELESKCVAAGVNGWSCILRESTCTCSYPNPTSPTGFTTSTLPLSFLHSTQFRCLCDGDNACSCRQI